jgi:hypothetical protein
MGKKGPNLNLATRPAIVFIKSLFGGSLSLQISSKSRGRMGRGNSRTRTPFRVAKNPTHKFWVGNLRTTGGLGCQEPHGGIPMIFRWVLVWINFHQLAWRTKREAESPCISPLIVDRILYLTDSFSRKWHLFLEKLVHPIEGHLLRLF